MNGQPIPRILCALAVLAALLLVRATGANAQGAGLITVEGIVERVESEHPEGQPIISHATVRVERQLEGEPAGASVVITYEGGTVGDLTLSVSHEPELVEGMRIRVRLQPSGAGDYRITDADTDLTILSEPARAAYVTGGTWADASIPPNVKVVAGTADVAGNGEAKAILAAMDTWFAVTCNYYRFAGVEANCSAAFGQPDGVNCINWAPGPDAAHPEAGAVTKRWSLGGKLVEFDMLFYENTGAGPNNWSLNPGSNTLDVESFALHELGHALGLDHSSDATSVMYPTLKNGTTKRAPVQDDINGVCASYRIPTPDNIYVDSRASGLQKGDSAHPFAALWKGYNALAKNGVLNFAGGNYPGPVTFDRAMTVKSSGGVATIGK